MHGAPGTEGVEEKGGCCNPSFPEQLQGTRWLGGEVPSPLSRLSAVCWEAMADRGIKGAAFDKSSLIEDAKEQRIKEPLELGML